MGSDIDWVIALTKTPIIRYLNKYEALSLSLINKRIRIKLYPILFNNLTVNPKILLSHSNYFQHEKYYQFDNLTFKEKFKLIKKYGISKELAFKEVQIDPFIKEASNTLNSTSASIHCKVLNLYRLDRACYFIFPLFSNYLNLNKLILIWCDISYTKFFNLLKKLESLEELEMIYVNLIFSTNEASNISPNLQFPKSLTKLIYRIVKFGTTDFPETRPLEFVRNTKRGYFREDLNLIPQYLPKLKSIVFYNKDWNVSEFDKLLNECPVLEYVNRPNT